MLSISGKHRLLWLTFIFLANVIIELVTVLTIANLMSQVLLGKPSVGFFFGLIDLGAFQFSTTVYLLACSLIAMTLLSFSMKVILRVMSETIGVNLSLMVFERVTNHRKYRIDTEKVKVSDTVNYLTKYVTNFTSGLLPASLSTVADTVSLFAIIIFLYFLKNP